METVSLYIHIPFCLRKCSYCDFYSLEGRDREISRYVEVLEKEILYKSLKTQSSVQSVYFGGGTPSRLKSSHIQRLLNLIKKQFNLSGDCEITVEVNPESASLEFLEAASESGVNRISMGAQSFIPQILKILGRPHLVNDIYKTFENVRHVGFQNISLDLMFGSPGESLSDWEKSLRCALELSPEHLSIYSLTLELETPLFIQINTGKVSEPDIDLAADMFQMGIETLGKAGYIHYEISNFCLPGFYSRHNLNYWNNGEYLGLGAGAYSYLSGERYRNTEDLKEYLQKPDGFLLRYEIEPTTPETGAAEDFLLGLRKLKSGVNLDIVRLKRGEGALNQILNRLGNSLQEGFLHQNENQVVLTNKGIFFADEVLKNLL